ncbi:MAG: EAL domain-containing protein [Nitrospirae bacterium]|nr:EAL domain-containing protein [Nitrospirota bacterium]
MRILIVEDSQVDAELIEREIQKVLPECTFQQVETEEAFLNALDEFKPDIIISDYMMPLFDGLTALKLTLEKTPLTPFIIVTGSVNEDTAVECMKAGATNYVIKQSLKRLGPAVLHAIEEKKIRIERLKAEEELCNAYFSEATLRMILSESLENIRLEEILQKTLNMIITVPWITFEPMGSIFLVEDEKDVLVLKAQINLPEALKKSHTYVPFGKYLCGQAALTQQIQYMNFYDGQFNVIYKEISPCAQYAIPIVSGGKTLGVINVFMKEGHVRDEKEENFLLNVANTLASIIMRKKAEERIDYLAYYDELTGLPNRNLFIDRIKHGIERAERTSKIVAVLIMDIDNFKSINDIYGNEAGDSVLKEVAERFSNAIRRGDTVARLGNDEFGIALFDIADSKNVVSVMEKILNYVCSPLSINNNEIALTFGTGISLYPLDSENQEGLLKKANLALVTAKKEGRKNYKFYTEELNVKASEFLSMERNMYYAIKNKEFLLHYQPYWDINTKKMVGMEALMRWQSKDMGLVSPGKFISVLEDTGMIIDVGEWILRTAIRQVKEWQNKEYPVLPVSVNLSLVQFKRKNLVDMFNSIIREYGYYPSLLTIEITESAFMQDIEYTSSVLRKLKDIGVSISIDDFGTGYSSLAHLKRFPIDNLKIDTTFIRDMVKDPDSASIVIAIINMAHTLNLKTIAEGIETEEQLNILRLLRCDMGQGYYLSKPFPAEEIEKLLKQ